ncbi:hypothetical protein [Planctomycetes bacterium CA13]
MLQTIPIPRLPSSIAEHAKLIAEANRRVDAFTKSRRETIHNFVVCDFAVVGAAIEWIANENLICGNAFCEWGSGLGVVTMMAAIQGFDAVGIEVESDLIDEARRLADDFSIPAGFVEGSFLPEDRSAIADRIQDIDHVDLDAASAYEELGSSIDEFDLIFAFPWPGEHQYFAELFDGCASDGALLMTYDGRNQLVLQRRVG